LQYSHRQSSHVNKQRIGGGKRTSYDNKDSAPFYGNLTPLNSGSGNLLSVAFYMTKCLVAKAEIWALLG
jgi:hypothetical protein